MNNYTAKDIQSLDYFTHIRRYPGMYAGSKDEHGLLHCVKELISNSIDEYLNGSGDTIIIKTNDDGSFYIKDNGRGIPHGQHSKDCSTLQACYGIANTGGKFNNATGESGYNTSGGEHGTGGKVVNALSTKMIVTTAREGIKEIVEFSKGEFISYKQEESNEQGVEVTFYPDAEIFETIIFDNKKIETMIQEFSFLCSGLKFIFNDKEFYSENGLEDYFNYLNKGKEIICEPIYINNEEGSYQVEAILGYNKSYSSTVKLYTNNIPQEKGTHLTGFKTALTASLNSFARENKWLKEKEDNLNGSDYEEGQILILNFKMIDPVFKGQNKEELSSSEGRTYVQKLVKESLTDYFETNKEVVKKIFDKAYQARRAREAARKAREAVRKPKKEKGLKAAMQLSDKFIDCTNKKANERNLLVVEGLSAGASTIEARDPKRDAIYMLRGKILSTLKQDIDKILKNQELSDIIRVIGAGFNETFNVDKMNFDKIVITSDQDSDGENIELLLITFFFTYMRDLVLNGKLYRAVTPLYIVRYKKEELYFYSDKEFDEWKKDKIGYDITRCKG